MPTVQTAYSNFLCNNKVGLFMFITEVNKQKLKEVKWLAQDTYLVRESTATASEQPLAPKPVIFFW